MKNYRVTLSLLGILAVLTGCYFYLGSMNPFADKTDIFKLPEGSIVELTLSSVKGVVRFTKNVNGWSMVDPSFEKIDQKKLNLLEYLLDNLKALRIIAEEAEDLGQYGLDQPQLSITLKLKTGATRTLLVGAETASKMEYYAVESTKQRVYTVSRGDLDGFKGDPSDFRDRNFLTINPAAVNSMSVTTYSKQEFKIIRGPEGKWQFSLPVTAQAKGDAVNEILKQILKLKIKDFITDKAADLSMYGLDVPVYSVTIGDRDGQVQTLNFGKKDETSGSLYMRVSGNEEIYTISTTEFKPEYLEMGELLNEAPLSISITQVNRVVIINQGRQVEFIRDRSKQDDRFTLAGKAVNTEDFTTLYVNIMALSSEGYGVGRKGQLSGLTVILELLENEKVRAEFTRRDASSYSMIINGKLLPLYVGARKVELVRKWVKRLEEATLR